MSMHMQVILEQSHARVRRPRQSSLLHLLHAHVSRVPQMRARGAFEAPGARQRTGMEEDTWGISLAAAQVRGVLLARCDTHDIMTS